MREFWEWVVGSSATDAHPAICGLFFALLVFWVVMVLSIVGYLFTPFAVFATIVIAAHIVIAYAWLMRK